MVHTQNECSEWMTGQEVQLVTWAGLGSIIEEEYIRDYMTLAFACVCSSPYSLLVIMRMLCDFEVWNRRLMWWFTPFSISILLFSFICADNSKCIWSGEPNLANVCNWKRKKGLDWVLSGCKGMLWADGCFMETQWGIWIWRGIWAR